MVTLDKTFSSLRNFTKSYSHDELIETELKNYKISKISYGEQYHTISVLLSNVKEKTEDEILTINDLIMVLNEVNKRHISSFYFLNNNGLHITNRELEVEAFIESYIGNIKFKIKEKEEDK